MNHPTQTEVDVAIVGAGPVGLCLATSLAQLGLVVAVIEKSPLGSLAEPQVDGRDIALTHRSVDLLDRLGAWSEIDAREIAPLDAARVINGRSTDGLVLDRHLARQPTLGHLVSNHLIRRAAFRAATRHAGIHLLTQCQLRRFAVEGGAVRLQLEDGAQLRCRLLVAADSRFSETRRAMGLSANMLDFGRSMLVCRMRHEIPHQRTAWEWFGNDGTLALLPLNDSTSSVVVTVPETEAVRLRNLPAAQFDAAIEARFERRLGPMHLTGQRYVYPLVAAFARRFVTRRGALVGDAAVGMHPVTAHGFNLGLQGQATLAASIAAALRAGRDPGGDDVLGRYERTHKRQTLPLYLATNAIVRLYTDERPLARFGRATALRIAQRLPPFKRGLVAALTAPARDLPAPR